MPRSLPRLTSRQHPVVQRCRTLSRARTHNGDVLLDGGHLVAEAVRADVEIEIVLVTPAFLDSAAERDVPIRLAKGSTAVYEVTETVLDAASPSRQPSGIVAIARWTTTERPAVFASQPALVVSLHGVQDPGNVGAVMRSADALGATGVMTDATCADPAGWKALRGSMGSVFRVPVARASLAETLDDARRQSVGVVASVARGGTPLPQVKLGGPTVLLFGGEGAGLPDAELPADVQRMTIPMREGVDSLNVAVSAALVLYEARRQRQGGGR